MKIEPHIRWMIRRDMPEVLEIENASFEFRWDEDDFVRSLRRSNCIGMVAEIEDRVVGYFIYELTNRLVHVFNFAVHPLFRFQGVGAAMVEKLASKLSADRRTKVVLEVRETNLDACLFFNRMGFIATEIVPDFYDDCDDDAIVFTRRYGWEAVEA